MNKRIYTVHLFTYVKGREAILFMIRGYVMEMLSSCCCLSVGAKVKLSAFRYEIRTLIHNINIVKYFLSTRVLSNGITNILRM